MLGLALTGTLPFPRVTLHGVICDAKGRKMSKSLGNVIDPLHVVEGATVGQLTTELAASRDHGYIDDEEYGVAVDNMLREFPGGIPQNGADPLRWGLASYDIKSQQINLDMAVVQGAGAWCNKIWQLARFLNMAHERANQVMPDLVFSSMIDTVTGKNGRE